MASTTEFVVTTIPAGATMGRALPATGFPDPATTIPTPSPAHPDKVNSRRGKHDFRPGRGWRFIYVDFRRRRSDDDWSRGCYHDPAAGLHDTAAD
jgi:hypothetical protein